MKKVSCMLVLLAVILAMGSCSKQETHASTVVSPSTNSSLSPDTMEKIFPMKTGNKWVYEVELVGEDLPLQYDETAWPMGNVGSNFASYASRGVILPRGNGDEKKKNFALEFQVKGKAEKQGRLEYPHGVEIEIIKDELGIFPDDGKVFWAVATSARLMANLVITHSSDSIRNPMSSGMGVGGFGEGSSVRLIFFVDKPGLQIRISESPDSLLFTGLEKLDGANCLHFLRKVEASKEAKAGADSLGKSFTEDCWYVPEKGLVRLEQKIAGKTSMIWKLKSFTVGQ